MEKLVKANFTEIKGDDDQESLLFVKEFDELLSIYIETADNYKKNRKYEQYTPWK